jgi:UDPglucose--hexose-1-phosphate uridylyltransferase
VDLEFKKRIAKARFRNPNLKFEIDTQEIEYRKDPLLGRLSVIPHELKKKASFYYGVPDKKALQETVEQSKKTCFFCPERIDQVTPKFLETINPEGRFKEGKATCFPNIFPYFEHSAVVAVSDVHYLPLNEITPEIYGNALKAAINYISHVFVEDRAMKFPLIGANFLIPAGSTIVHPHIQVMMGDEELFKIKLLREKSSAFMKKTQVNYWAELIKKERELDERFIAQTGNVQWYAPFAPLGNNEVQAVILNKANFLELSAEDIILLGKGIANILHYYDSKNISSFNFLLYSGPLNEKLDSFCVGFQIISRPPFRPFYVNLDAWFLQQLADGSLIIEFPEQIAQDVKKYFDS